MQPPIPKIFIISLPRTGTKSLSKMLMMLGYRVKHIPSVRLDINVNLNEFDVYADTPIYRPSVVERFVNEHPENKFIYLNRDINDWVKSFEDTKLSRNYTNLLTTNDISSLHMSTALDRESLLEVFNSRPYSTEMAKEQFILHKESMFNLIPKDKLLSYWFNDSWEPLCQFLGKSNTDLIIPHINKNNLFEPII